MTEYISDELFHFVGSRSPQDHERNFETLLAIIRSGCVSSNPPTIGWGPIRTTVTRGASLASEELVVSNVTCYCDIPLPSLRRHTVKYGCFGLSFDRGKLAKYGARPVMYVPKRADDHLSPYGTSLLNSIQAIFEGFMRQLYEPHNSELEGHSRIVSMSPKSPEDAVVALRSMLVKDFLAFIKPYDSDLSVDDVKYFYAEREWRRLGSFMFELPDIRTVVVGGGYESRFREALPGFCGRLTAIDFPSIQHCASERSAASRRPDK